MRRKHTNSNTEITVDPQPTNTAKHISTYMNISVGKINTTTKCQFEINIKIDFQLKIISSCLSRVSMLRSSASPSVPAFWSAWRAVTVSPSNKLHLATLLHLYNNISYHGVPQQQTALGHSAPPVQLY